MSRYTIQEMDLVCTIGMDYAVQFWCRDYRNVAIPYERPAMLTVVDSLGNSIVQTVDPDIPGTIIDPLNDAIVQAASVNGMIQVVIPRNVTADLVVGSFNYDLWATLYDVDQIALFPQGQSTPVAKGRFIVQPRYTEMGR